MTAQERSELLSSSVKRRNTLYQAVAPFFEDNLNNSTSLTNTKNLDIGDHKSIREESDEESRCSQETIKSPFKTSKPISHLALSKNVALPKLKSKLDNQDKRPKINVSK